MGAEPMNHAHTPPDTNPHAFFDPAATERVAALEAHVAALQHENTALRNALEQGHGVPQDILDAALREANRSGIADRLSLEILATELLATRAALEHATDSTFLVNDEARLIYVNRAAGLLLECARDELQGKPLFEIEPGVTPEQWQEKRKTLAQIRHLSEHSAFRTKSGRLVPVQVTREFIEIGGRAFDCCFARKAEDRKRSDTERAMVVDCFRAVCDAAPVGIHMFRLDDDGHLVFSDANPAADAILGVNHNELVGRTIEDAFPQLASTSIAGQYRRVVDSGAPWRAHQAAYDGQGHHCAFEVYAFRTAPRCMAAIFFDIRERQQLDARTRESEKLDAIGLLAGGIAHSFRNQLTGVLGFAELIRNQAVDPAVKTLAEQLMDAGSQASRLTDQLLAFAGKGRYRSEDVDLHHALDCAIDLFAHR
ncbi:MAG: PAS domain-containing protein, partial [Polyangiaceae bacterium]|nr:PAS domain-containing protein [Polyangiaceae bacterium]